MPKSSTGIIVLAAGGSIRMGAPKQLLRVNGVPLIQSAVASALDSGCRPVVVVLGAYAETIEPELSGLDAHVATNPAWEGGLSGSIVIGLKKLITLAPESKAAILMLADQASLTGASLQKLTAAFRDHPSRIIASHYSAQIGTPALFPNHYFAQLLALEGTGGAKSVLKRHHQSVTAVDLPEAAADLDTPEQFESWIKTRVTGDSQDCNGQAGSML